MGGSRIAELCGLSSKSIAFVLAFPQMEVDAKIYMESRNLDKH